MEAFLVASKSALHDPDKFRQIKVVMGNCTCDLDSAVCALAHGFFCYRQLTDDDKKNVAVIPVMNVSDNEFRVKTEVVWFLRQNKIPLDLLTFRNQIDLCALNKEKRLQLTLVDHHTLDKRDSEMKTSVVEIIDHRPQDPNWLWPNANVTINPVGSCATLVAKNIFENNPEIVDSQLRDLLRGPIVVDTHNFSVEASRAKPLDFEVIRQLESLEISSSLRTREDLHARILEAKMDISELTAGDLLIKDLKIVDDIAIPVFPILVEKFVDLPNAIEYVISFVSGNSFALAVLIGMDLKNGKIQRDIAVFAPRIDGDNELATKIISSLDNSTDPPLKLQRLTTDRRDEDSEIPRKDYELLMYRLENVRATRKQILPIIQRALAEFRCRC